MSNRSRSKAIRQIDPQPTEGTPVVGTSPLPTQLFPLDQLPKRPWMPKRRGRGISYFTVLRWALSGRGGAKLRTLMVGRQRCTTDEWAMHFFEKLTNADAGEQSKAPAPHDHDHAMKELEAAGI